ncbi:MAG: sigma-70 family RNA polymerase sigma factor, partial [Patescibacteria group bacterium]
FIGTHYRAQIKHDVLSEDEITNLFKRVNKKDRDATVILVKQNMRLVASLASKYKCYEMDFYDLVQEGCIGLLRAIEKFDYKRGDIKFSTYARYWIRQEMMRCIIKYKADVRIPEHAWIIRQRILKHKKLFKVMTGRFPTLGELAQQLDLSKEKLQEYIVIYDSSTTSLDLPIESSETGADTTLHGVIESGTFLGAVELSEAKECLKNLLDTVDAVFLCVDELTTERKASIFKMRYQLTIKGNRITREPMEKIGEDFGVTREAIRQSMVSVWLKVQRKLKINEKTFMDNFYKIDNLEKIIKVKSSFFDS